MSAPKNDITTYKRLIKYILPYKMRLIFAFLLLSGASAAHTAISAVIYIIVNGMTNKTYVSFSNIPNAPAFLSDISFSTKWIPVIIVGVFVVRGFLDYFSKYMMSTTGLRAVMDVRNDLYSRLTYLSCDFYSNRRAGDLISRIMNDVNNINSGITTIIADAIKSPLIILWSIPIIFILGGKFAIICVAIFPLVAIPIVVLGRQLRKIAKGSMEKKADITSLLHESFIGIRIIKAFGMEKLEIEKFKGVSKQVYNFTRKSVRVTEIQRPIVEIMGAVGIALTITFAMRVMETDRFMAFAGALFLLYDPFKKISKINNVLQSALASGNRIFEIMDQPRSILESTNPKTLSSEVNSIEFQNVSFGYTEDKMVLENVNFTVNKGEIVALVGPSGGGKTSLVNLLPRFYDVSSGEIVINSEDIRSYSLKSLRDQIGLVSQETVLFSGTVGDNISYGKPEASPDEIIQAARAAHAHDFISQLQKGYETKIGERGFKLSGGQRQRISIARAILKNPPILIFDEATSHLDTESEREVQVAIENLIHGRTVFVIAHRLSTIQNANKIFVIEAGRIVQKGNHESLLSQEGPYKKLYNLQFQ